MNTYIIAAPNHPVIHVNADNKREANRLAAWLFSRERLPVGTTTDKVK